MAMTYRELVQRLQEMDDEQLDCDVTIEIPCDYDDNECYPGCLRIANDNHSSLDDNHPVIFRM